ncbi:MAG: hypothetical protein JWO69_1617 [Thermoleophilia bacterium]|jgi:hypothetical protein|nr:hypothetical protein [Thermoleophilia bacterium]
MLTTTSSRFLLSIATFTLVALLAAPIASAESFAGSDRLVHNKRIVGHVKSVLIQDSTTSVAVDARVNDFAAPTAPATYRARLVVNLTCAPIGSDPTDADYAWHVNKMQFMGPWRMNRINSTKKGLLAEPLFTRCPKGQEIDNYLARFQVIDSRRNRVGLSFLAPSTPLL